MNYWTEAHEKLVIDYKNETDSIKRSIIYNQLRPAILKMINGIHFKYCNFSGIDEYLYEDCETHIATYAILKYNHGHGATAYSYLSNSVKHYLLDFFKRKYVDKLKFNEIEFYIDEFEENYFNDSEYFQEIKELKYKAKQRISDLLKSETKKAHQKILVALRAALELDNFNKLYFNYVILNLTQYEPEYINRICKIFGIERLIYTEKNKDFYQKIINDYVKKNGKNKNNYVLLAFEDYDLKLRHEIKKFGAKKRKIFMSDKDITKHSDYLSMYEKKETKSSS